MILDIVSDNFILTNALRFFIDNKFLKIKKYFIKKHTGSGRVKVFLSLDGRKHRVNIFMQMPIGHVVVSAETNNMYDSVNLSFVKLKKQFLKHKGKAVPNHLLYSRHSYGFNQDPA